MVEWIRVRYGLHGFAFRFPQTTHYFHIAKVLPWASRHDEHVHVGLMYVILSGGILNIWNHPAILPLYVGRIKYEVHQSGKIEYEAHLYM